MTNTYVWEQTIETPSEIDSDTLGNAGYGISDIVDKAKQTTIDQAVNGLADQAKQNGLTWVLIDSNADAGYTIRTRYRYQVTTWDEFGSVTGQQNLESDTEPDLTGLTGVYMLSPKNFYKIWISFRITFTSDMPLMGSPIAPVVLVIIGRIISAIIIIVIAYFAIQAVSSWLKSLTSTHSTVTTVVQTPVVDQSGKPVLDGDGNPVYTTTTKTEDTTSGALSGSPSTAGGDITMIVIIIAVLVLAFMFFGGVGAGRSKRGV